MSRRGAVAVVVLVAWVAARDFAREIGGGVFSVLGERGRVSVNVETV